MLSPGNQPKAYLFLAATKLGLSYRVVTGYVSSFGVIRIKEDRNATMPVWWSLGVCYWRVFGGCGAPIVRAAFTSTRTRLRWVMWSSLFREWRFLPAWKLPIFGSGLVFATWMIHHLKNKYLNIPIFLLEFYHGFASSEKWFRHRQLYWWSSPYPAWPIGHIKSWTETFWDWIYMNCREFSLVIIVEFYQKIYFDIEINIWSVHQRR